MKREWEWTQEIAEEFVAFLKARDVGVLTIGYYPNGSWIFNLLVPQSYNGSPTAYEENIGKKLMAEFIAIKDKEFRYEHSSPARLSG